MLDRFTRREVAGLPIGFAVALVSFLIGLGAAWNVALSLSSIQSFSDIAKPSGFAVVFGTLAAVIAVVTTRRLDRDQD